MPSDSTQDFIRSFLMKSWRSMFSKENSFFFEQSTRLFIKLIIYSSPSTSVKKLVIPIRKISISLTASDRGVWYTNKVNKKGEKAACMVTSFVSRWERRRGSSFRKISINFWFIFWSWGVPSRKMPLHFYIMETNVQKAFSGSFITRRINPATKFIPIMLIIKFTLTIPNIFI